LYLGGEKLKKKLFAYQLYILMGLRLVLAPGFCFFPGSFLGAQETGPSSGGRAPAALPAQAAEQAVSRQAASPEEALILGEESPGVPISPGPVSFFAILRTILVLLLAAVAIYVLVYFLKKIARPQELRDPNLRVLASVHLGQNRFIYAVTLGAKVWLVGAGEGGLTHIADIEEQEAIDALLLEESRRNAGARQGFPDFRSMLRRFSPSSGKDAGFTGPSVADNIRKRQDRLKGL
jgi:flagellar protein FliO/FliZ